MSLYGKHVTTVGAELENLGLLGRVQGAAPFLDQKIVVLDSGTKAVAFGDKDGEAVGRLFYSAGMDRVLYSWSEAGTERSGEHFELAIGIAVVIKVVGHDLVLSLSHTG